MTSKHDDLLGAESACGDHSAETQGCAIANNRDHATRLHARGKGRVVARAHDVGERQE